MANSKTKNEHLRDLEPLETSESSSPSRTISQDPEDLGLSTPHCPATGVVLQGCATGMFFPNCAPEVLLAADILASGVSQSSFKTMSTTCKSASQDRCPFLSRKGNVPKISKPQEPWTSHIFGPTDEKEDYRSPMLEVQLPGMRLVQAYRPNMKGYNSSPVQRKKFGDEIKALWF